MLALAKLRICHEVRKCSLGGSVAHHGQYCTATGLQDTVWCRAASFCEGRFSLLTWSDFERADGHPVCNPTPSHLMDFDSTLGYPGEGPTAMEVSSPSQGPRAEPAQAGWRTPRSTPRRVWASAPQNSHNLMAHAPALPNLPTFWGTEEIRAAEFPVPTQDSIADASISQFSLADEASQSATDGNPFTGLSEAVRARESQVMPVQPIISVDVSPGTLDTIQRLRIPSFNL